MTCWHAKYTCIDAEEEEDEGKTSVFQKYLVTLVVMLVFKIMCLFCSLRNFARRLMMSDDDVPDLAYSSDSDDDREQGKCYSKNKFVKIHCKNVIHSTAPLARLNCTLHISIV